MANWILFARDASGKPIVSAMDGSTVEESLPGDSKANLIGLLKRFSSAGTFVVTKIDNAVTLQPQGTSGASSIPISTSSATWLQFFRDADGQPIVVAMDAAKAIEYYSGNINKSLSVFLNRHSSANTFQVAPDGTPIPQGIPEWIPPLPPNRTSHRVMLEIGHGPGVPFDPGAIAHDGQTTEYSLNVIAAQAARDVIVAAGIQCVINDMPQDTLHSIGLEASGFDIFCSVHHNAFNGTVQRTEAFSHATKGGVLDAELADLISNRVSKALGITDGGARQARLGVLSGAEDTNVRASVLAEVYFIDDRISAPSLQDFSTRGGAAIGQAILDWLTKHP
ncbi:MAG: N-acetylmuramoyl-L-alanine amidase [Phormidesmis sp. CAN_BIN44]|nr:N-acetylmuramoyl-L-alanine amidase [Phormidesmis sp. CAN_BIN44]